MALSGNPANTDRSWPGYRSVPDHELFVPKDEHCGIWHSPPNADCASSFGDNGTTASVSCYGELIHLSQHLAIGSSGIFTLDDGDLDEPYFVCGRSEQLDRKSQSSGKQRYHIGVLNPQPASPVCEWVSAPGLGIQEVPRVKWVNWRWPRHEYLSSDSRFTATSQWLVHKNIVLQQLTFRKPEDEPRECFATVLFSRDRYRSLIRDIDYLDSRNHFNEVSETHSDFKDAYKAMDGPNGCGRVLTHKLPAESLKPDQKLGKQIDEDARPDGTPRNSDERSQIPQAFGSRPDEDKVSHGENPLLHPDQKVEANKAPAEDFRSSDPKTMEDIEGPPRKSTTATQHRFRKFSQSVAAVMTVLVNGEVVPGLQSIRLQLPNKGVSEVVYAYKLIHLPGHEVDWRNFIVSAHDADVSRILKEETNRLWGSSSGLNTSLPNLGLSLRDLNMLWDPSKEGLVAGNQGEQAQKANDSTSHEAPQDESKSEETSEDAEPPAVAPPPEMVGLRPNPDTPKGTPNNSSARNHIEYLTWRHLEHILSVCAFPLSTPSLIESGIPEQPVKVENEAIALTCGDMSGHRVCTSTSL